MNANRTNRRLRYSLLLYAIALALFLPESLRTLLMVVLITAAIFAFGAESARMGRGVRFLTLSPRTGRVVPVLVAVVGAVAVFQGWGPRLYSWILWNWLTRAPAPTTFFDQVAVGASVSALVAPLLLLAAVGFAALSAGHRLATTDRTSGLAVRQNHYVRDLALGPSFWVLVAALAAGSMELVRSRTELRLEAVVIMVSCAMAGFLDGPPFIIAPNLRVLRGVKGSRQG